MHPHVCKPRGPTVAPQCVQGPESHVCPPPHVCKPRRPSSKVCKPRVPYPLPPHMCKPGGPNSHVCKPGVPVHPHACKLGVPVPHPPRVQTRGSPLTCT